MSKLFDDVKDLTEHEVLVALGANKKKVFPTRYVHPVMQSFPEIPDADYDRLLIDIRLNGQRKAIGLYQGYVWDGRARYRICLQLNIMPKVAVIRESNPILHLIHRDAEGRYGGPNTPERRSITPKLFVAEKWKRDFIDRRQQFIAVARERFDRRWKTPEPCAVCGLRAEYSHAHHSLPLAYQFALGLEKPDQTHDWLCAVHHKLMHRMIGREITGAGRRYVSMDGIDPVAALRVLNRALKVFYDAGGIPMKDRWGMTHL